MELSNFIIADGSITILDKDYGLLYIYADNYFYEQILESIKNGEKKMSVEVPEFLKRLKLDRDLNFHIQKGNYSARLSNRILKTLEYYYNTPLFDEYYELLLQKVDHKFLLQSGDYDKKIIEWNGKVMEYDLVSDHVKEVHVDVRLQVNSGITVGLIFDQSDFETDLKAVLLKAPYLWVESIPDFYGTFKGIELFLKEFWDKDIDGIRKISPTVYNHPKIQEKFATDFIKKFQVNEGFIEAIQKHATDSVFLLSLATAGKLTLI